MSQFNYYKMPFEEISCNLCGSNNFFARAHTTGNNLKAQTCICKECGLVYINPRMTKAGYDEYYKYFYREDRARVHGEKREPKSMEESFASGKRFGSALIENILPHIEKGGLTLDVGSNTGGVLASFADRFPAMEVMGIEPSAEASEFANTRGIKTTPSLFENFSDDTAKNISNILCLQTLNHLLDPKGFMIWSYNRLKVGGRLILAVKNFRHQARRAGFVEGAIQIDHPYMFVPETLRLMVESAGFKARFEGIDEYKTRDELFRQKKNGLHIHHMRIVGEKTFHEFRPPVSISRPDIYRKIRKELSPFRLKTYYLFHYSARFALMRNFVQKIRFI